MISLQKTDKSVNELRKALKAALRRNPDAYTTIGMVSGVRADRVREIANGADPTAFEHAVLAGLA